MEVNEISKFKILNKNHERNKFFCLFIWLDTKLEITENKKDCIMRGELETYIKTIILIIGIMKILIL